MKALSANIKTDARSPWNGALSVLVRYKFLYLLLVPVVVFTVIFAYIPMVGIIVAFQDYNLWKGPLGSPFVGLKHFISIFTISSFKDAVINTLWYGFVNIVIGFPFPILLALMFNEMRSKVYKRAAQTVSYLPYFLSWISVIGLVYAFLSMEGIFNEIRMLLFGQDVERLNLLMDTDYFLPIMVITNLWKGIGWSSVVFLAAITGIDPQLYEAAYVDGCNRLKQIWYITLPGILPTVMMVLIFSVGGLVNSNFELVYGLQNLYTQDSTEVVNTIVYRSGILRGEYSMSTAFGLAQGLVTFALVGFANIISRKTSNVGIY